MGMLYKSLVVAKNIGQKSCETSGGRILSSPASRILVAGLVAGLTSEMVTKQSIAVTPVDLKDDRSAKSTGFDLIYEARDLDLPQNVRDGLTQARTSVDDTKKRVVESKSESLEKFCPTLKRHIGLKQKKLFDFRLVHCASISTHLLEPNLKRKKNQLWKLRNNFSAISKRSILQYE